MWIQEGNNVSLSWDPVKAKDNESDVIGYMVGTQHCSHVHKTQANMNGRKGLNKKAANWNLYVHLLFGACSKLLKRL